MEQPPPPSFADATIQRYLAAADVAMLAMLTPSGAPLATPMWFVHDEQQLAMVTVDGIAKVRNIEADGRISVAVEGGERGAIHAVVLAGDAAFVEGTERVEWGERFRQKYSPHIEALWSGTALPDNRRVFVMTPRVVSAFGLD